MAYRQPVTRGDVDVLRGVDSGGPLNFLLERKLVAPNGRKDAPGRPWLFETGPQFLEQFGLKSLDDLPDLAEFAALGRRRRRADGEFVRARQFESARRVERK